MKAQRRGQGLAANTFQQGIDALKRLPLHFLLHHPPLVIQGVQLCRQGHRLHGIIADQATDSHGHVFESPRGIEARTHGKTQVGSVGVAVVPTGHAHQGHYARSCQASADAGDAVLHQNPVVTIQGDQVGHGSKRNEVEPL
jgi:hypothetical protein